MLTADAHLAAEPAARPKVYRAAAPVANRLLMIDEALDHPQEGGGFAC